MAMPVRDDAAFGGLDVPDVGAAVRPEVDAPHDHEATRGLGLVRVLDLDGTAGGDWDPHLDRAELVRGLRDLSLVRELDRRLMAAQRQGKTSFYMQATGEEAIACGFQAALDPGDMNFPTYRQQGLLVAAGYPLELMVAQVFSNEMDPMKGRQMPVFYSARSHGFFSISGNLATQYVQAVGWAMASEAKGDGTIAAAWIGDGATAESDFHAAMVFASTYRPPVVLNIVNNQFAISTAESVARGASATLAERGHGFGFPALRVDGNDYLAVVAASRWAVERARGGWGPTAIEWVTYRVAAHSSADDPSGYRARTEPSAWPLGDPIERLRGHLVRCHGWTDAEQADLDAEVIEQVAAAMATAEAHGTLDAGPGPIAGEMFDDVFRELPPNLRRQRQATGF